MSAPAQYSDAGSLMNDTTAIVNEAADERAIFAAVIVHHCGVGARVD
jgi:hypothetical protein